MSKPTVGWREWVALPGLGVDRIRAKVDTGARSTTLHAAELKTFYRDDTEWVRFTLVPRKHHRPVICEAPVCDRRWVTSSSGERQLRPFVRTGLRLGPHHWEVELSLTSRTKMRFPMLLGRTALNGRFLVDPAAANLMPRPPRARSSS